MSKEKEYLELDLDFDAIMPGDEFKIGSKSVIIRPLGLRQYADTIKKIRAFVKELAERGVNLTNWNQGENILVIAEVVSGEFPDLLQECSGISVITLDKLPPDIILGLVNKVIEVNMKSKESFLGNLESLSATVNKMFLSATEKVEEVTSKAKKPRTRK